MTQSDAVADPTQAFEDALRQGAPLEQLEPLARRHVQLNYHGLGITRLPYISQLLEAGYAATEVRKLLIRLASRSRQTTVTVITAMASGTKTTP